MSVRAHYHVAGAQPRSIARGWLSVAPWAKAVLLGFRASLRRAHCMLNIVYKEKLRDVGPCTRCGRGCHLARNEHEDTPLGQLDRDMADVRSLFCDLQICLLELYNVL